MLLIREESMKNSPQNLILMEEQSRVVASNTGACAESIFGLKFPLFASGSLARL